MNLDTLNIAIIGGGNLGRALARGLVKSGSVSADQLTITRRSQKNLDALAEEGFNTSTDNSAAVAAADVIVLAVLPQQIDDVLTGIKAAIDPAKHLVISLVSSVKILQLTQHLGTDVKVVRAMPNTAIAIRESMTCITSSPFSKDQVPLVRALFDTVGITMEIREEQMTSATALCACGIAFFLRAIRAASQGGNEIDFHSGEALLMAAQTARGAASLLLANNSHPEDEIDKVTSPKGCTIAGLNQMEHNGFSSAFIRGIVTSAEKAGTLYESGE
jgi:pyrroline-5-carboxylate reductase